MAEVVRVYCEDRKLKGIIRRTFEPPLQLEYEPRNASWVIYVNNTCDVTAGMLLAYVSGAFFVSSEWIMDGKSAGSLGNQVDFPPQDDDMLAHRGLDISKANDINKVSLQTLLKGEKICLLGLRGWDPDVTQSIIRACGGMVVEAKTGGATVSFDNDKCFSQSLLLSSIIQGRNLYAHERAKLQIGPATRLSAAVLRTATGPSEQPRTGLLGIVERGASALYDGAKEATVAPVSRALKLLTSSLGSLGSSPMDTSPSPLSESEAKRPARGRGRDVREENDGEHGLDHHRTKIALEYTLPALTDMSRTFSPLSLYRGYDGAPEIQPSATICDVIEATRSSTLGIVIVLSGVSGSGKSTMRRELTRGGDMFVQARKELNLESLLKGGINVIFDSTHTTKAQRRVPIELARRSGTRAMLILFDAPNDVTASQLARRNRAMATAASAGGE